MNHMPEIAKMLGVEIGEEFTIFPIGGRYRISQSGLQFLSEKGEWVLSKYLKALLTGEYGTVKIPFEPKDGEYYYAVYRHLKHGDIKIGSVCWCGCWSDYVQKYCGNCFRTREEAEREKYNVYKKLTGREWGK